MQTASQSPTLPSSLAYIHPAFLAVTHRQTDQPGHPPPPTSSHETHMKQLSKHRHKVSYETDTKMSHNGHTVFTFCCILLSRKCIAFYSVQRGDAAEPILSRMTLFDKGIIPDSLRKPLDTQPSPHSPHSTHLSSSSTSSHSWGLSLSSFTSFHSSEFIFYVITFMGSVTLSFFCSSLK